jgi:peptidoglycan-N-acetylglucosamine deacetylase
MQEREVVSVIGAVRNGVRRAVDRIGSLVLSPPYGGRWGYVNHGSRDHRRIALTFDDGPSGVATEQVLDTLDRLGVPGTFFCVGGNVAFRPDLVRRMVDSGHGVGNHSVDHRRGGSLKLSGDSHIVGAEDEFEVAAGIRPTLYRPPWGWLTPWEARRLRRRGYTIVGWDVYTLDWMKPEVDPGPLVAGILRDTRPGSIILLHDGNPLQEVWHKEITVTALERAVPELQRRGFEFVTVADLLGVPAWHDVDRRAPEFDGSPT